MNLRSAGRGPVATLALLVAAAGAHAAPDAGQERSSYWQERTSFFKTFGRRADVVMCGDSLTDGAEWREMFPERDIVNRGIDGDTTDGVLARLDDIVSLHPRQTFVMIGINDFAEPARSVDAVFANYQAIVARLVQAGIQVFIQSTLPCNEAKGVWRSCASVNVKVRQLNARLATLASARVVFVDLSSVLAAEGGLKSELTIDGLHLNGPGYRLWRDRIAPFMGAGRPATRRAP